MLQQFTAHIQQQHLLPQGREVLLAISGGIDSVVLAHLMHSAGYRFAIAHCNFHLRPADCDRDELFVRQMAARYGVAVHVAQFDTQAVAARRGQGIEEAARYLRYTYFDQLLQQHGYAAVLTAHHRDDVAETFFLNLLRGTGLAGLHGILPVQGHLVRPMLIFSREQIEAYAQEHQLEHVEDSTNASLQYRRNQIRHQLMPLLRQLQPSVDDTLQHTIRHLQTTEMLYQHLLQPYRERMVRTLDEGRVEVDISVLPSAEIMRQQMLFELLKPYGFNDAVVADMLAASQSGKTFSSPTYTALLNRQKLILTPQCSDNQMFECVDNKRLNVRQVNIEDFSLNLKHLPEAMAVFDADKVAMPLALRHWREGDRFQPLGMKQGTQLLSDFFINHKYTLIEKQEQLLLVDAHDQILWILGRRTSHPSRVTPRTTTVLQVTIEVDKQHLKK